MENALKIVKYLAGPSPGGGRAPPFPRQGADPRHCIKKYLPEGGGSIFTFEIKGDESGQRRQFIDHLPVFSLLANVADVKSLVIHPATTTHSQCTRKRAAKQQGMRPNTIRLSIGIETAEDLIAALECGFQAVRNGEKA